MICWSCESDNPPGAKFCSSCGSKLLPDPGVEGSCRSCGAPIPLEARFCGYCGTPDPVAKPSAEATEAAVPSEELARAIAAEPGGASALAYDDEAEEDEALDSLEDDGFEDPELEDDEEEATIIRGAVAESLPETPAPVPRPKQPTEPARVAMARTLQDRLSADRPSPGAYSKKGPSLRAREDGKRTPPPPPIGRGPSSSAPPPTDAKVRPARPGEGAPRGFSKGAAAPSSPPAGSETSSAPVEPVPPRGGTEPAEAAEPPAMLRGGTAPAEAAEPPAMLRGDAAPTEAAEPPAELQGEGGVDPTDAPAPPPDLVPARSRPSARPRMPRTVTEPQKAVYSSPLPDAAAILAPPDGWPDITDELAEIRFSAIQGFDDDTRKAISDLRARHPGHPEVDILAEELGEATSSRPSLIDEDADQPMPVEGPPPRGRFPVGEAPPRVEEPGPEISEETGPIDEAPAAETSEEPLTVAMTIESSEPAEVGTWASVSPALEPEAPPPLVDGTSDDPPTESGGAEPSLPSAEPVVPTVPDDSSEVAEIDGLRLPAELVAGSHAERGVPEPMPVKTSDELLDFDATEFESLTADDDEVELEEVESLDDAIESLDDAIESLDDAEVDDDDGIEEPDPADRTMMVRGYQPPAPFGGVEPPELVMPPPVPADRSSTTLSTQLDTDERSPTLAPLGEVDMRSPDELETTLPPGVLSLGSSAHTTLAPDPDGAPSLLEAEPTPLPASSSRATIIPQEPDVDLDDELGGPPGMTAPARDADLAAASGEFSVAELGLDGLPDLEASTSTVPPLEPEPSDDLGSLTPEGTVIARAPMPPLPYGTGHAPDPVRPVRLLMIGARGQVVTERRIEAGTHLDIGRAPGEPWASDRRMEDLHARLFPAPGGLVVDDFGAPQGVYTQISDTIAVEDGDEFKVGQARLALQRVVGPDGVWGQLTLVRHDDPTPSSYRLDRNEILVGRDEGDITLPNDTFVSGDHCRFAREGNAVYLEDLGSSNGTYIRVRAGQCVAFGGLLLIGHTQFRVEPV